MKRGIIILILSILLILPIITATDISTCQELQNMQLNLADDYVLISDIPCLGFTFIPVAPFTGTFNGNDFKITNLEINLPDTNEVGLFGSSSGTIIDVVLESVSIKGHNSVGGLVGINTGTIQNSHVQGTIIADQGATPGSRVGGLAGQNRGTITKSSAVVDITGGYNNLGGLIGYQETTGMVYYSYAKGDITGSHSHIGGLVGRNFGTITNSYATGNTESTGDNDVGGLVGRSIGSITHSYATGNAKGTTTSGFGERIGGLIGRLETGGELKHSFATGPAEGSLDIGGLVGKNLGTITNSYRHYFPGNTIGIVEEDYSSFFSSTHPVYTGAIPWDFTTNWQINEGQNYPYLKWQAKDISDGICQSHENCIISPDCSCSSGFECIQGTCTQQLTCSGIVSTFEPTVFEDCSEIINPSYPCSKASDGNINTDWFGLFSSPEPKWIYGDLGERKCLRKVRVRLRGDGNFMWKPQTMDVQVSDNSVAWRTIYEDWTVNSVSTWVTLTIPDDIKAKYIRFWITDCNYWFYECGLFDCDWIFEPNGNNCNFQEFQFRTRDICTQQCSGKECGDDACGGTCPPGCTNPHGTTTCSAVGLCQPVCDTGWANCDGDNTNGCELDLRDPATCGTDCSTTACTSVEICSEGSCIPTASAYWANMLGQPITEAQIGDTVQLIYTGTDSTTFEIREEDALNDDNIRTGAEAITGNIINGKAIAKFTITQQDFDIGFADELDTDVELYFQIGSETSDNLIVEENSYDNSAPTVTITNPLLDDRFKIQTNTDFKQIATDEDDDLKLTWDFGDTTQETLTNCLTTTNCNTTHSYSNSGTKTITLTAEEMTRPKTASDTTRIFVYKPGINPFPIITTPQMNEIFQVSEVDFDANSSFVAECSSVCLSGTCYTVGDLQCYDLLKEPTNIPTEYDLSFEWTFTEGLERIGNWSNNYYQVVEFTKTFFRPTTHQAHLKLGYNTPPFDEDNIEWSDQIYTEFTISTTNPQCTIEDEISYWTYWDSGTGQLVTEEVTDAARNCFYNDGDPLTCCPRNKGECVTPGGTCTGALPPHLCSGYIDETSCERFNSETAERSIELGRGEGFCTDTQSRFDLNLGTCWWINDCKCAWDDITLSCDSTYSKSEEICGEIPSGGAGTCTIKTVSQTGDCANDDYVTYQWTATWSGIPADTPADCIEQVKQFACDDVIKMPFFTPLNLIITILSITLIYGYLIIRRKE